MATIGFIGVEPHSTAVSQLLVALSLTTALVHNEHVLVADGGGKPGRLETLFAQRFEHSPLTTIVRGRLDWLSAAERDPVSVRHLYDHLFFEMQADQTDGSRTVSQVSEVDVLVVCLNQNLADLQRLFAHPFLQSTELPRNRLMVIHNYDLAARLNLTSIRQRFAIDCPLFGLPYSTAVRNACNERELVDLLMRRMFASDATSDRALSRYINECKGMAELMMERCLL